MHYRTVYGLPLLTDLCVWYAKHWCCKSLFSLYLWSSSFLQVMDVIDLSIWTQNQFNWGFLKEQHCTWYQWKNWALHCATYVYVWSRHSSNQSNAIKTPFDSGRDKPWIMMHSVCLPLDGRLCCSIIHTFCLHWLFCCQCNLETST